MFRKTLNTLGVLVLVLSFILAACAQQPSATTAPEVPAETEAVAPVEPAETEAPADTEAPAETEEAATEEPAETEPPAAPSGDFEALSFSAPDCDYGGLFQTIEAVDELTVRFTMCVPDPAFPAKAAFTGFAIQSAEYLEETGGGGEGSALLEHAMGTGPYMVQEWRRGDELVLVRNENYWGDPAIEPTVVMRWSSEAAQRLLELQAGTVDGIDNVGPDDFESVEGDPNLQLLVRQALNSFYVGFNNRFPPFDNVQVRQAVAMAIDRQRLVDNFLPPGSEVATHFTPCSVPNGCAGEEWYEYDPEAARALLAEAGFPDGFATTLEYRDVVRSYLPQPGVVAQDIQAQLKETLNIDVTINVMESGAFLEAADAGTLEGLHLLGWGADYPDVTNFLDYHFGAGASDQFGDKFDAITEPLREGAALAGDDARQPFYEQANNAIKENIPMVPVSHAGSAVAYRAAIQNPHVSPLGNEYFATIEDPDDDNFVWMQNAEPISFYCADETDGETFRACEQVNEALLSYEIGGTAVQPGLATSCDPNEDLTEWTCNLRSGVTFHDGSTFDANDVVMTYVVQWDYSHPLHTGNTGAFTYFSALWGAFMNAPQE